MKSAWAARASVLGAVVASACCWLPSVLVALGVSAAGVSAACATIRPLFLAVSALLLGLAFFLHLFQKHAGAIDSECSDSHCRDTRFRGRGLWVATMVVFLVEFFPDDSWLMVGRSQPNSRAHDRARLQIVAINIEGMTCAICTVQVQQALATVPGLKDVSVRYPEGQAVLSVDSTSPPSYERLLKALERVGYRGTIEANN